jgi:hypothetical protein
MGGAFGPASQPDDDKYLLRADYLLEHSVTFQLPLLAPLDPLMQCHTAETALDPERMACVLMPESEVQVLSLLDLSSIFIIPTGGGLLTDELFWREHSSYQAFENIAFGVGITAHGPGIPAGSDQFTKDAHGSELLY